MITQTQTDAIFIHPPQQPLSTVMAPLLLLFQGNCLSLIYTTSFLFCFSSQQHLKTRDQNKTAFIAKITRLHNETFTSFFLMTTFFSRKTAIIKILVQMAAGAFWEKSCNQHYPDGSHGVSRWRHNDDTNQQANRRHFNTKKMTSQVLLTAHELEKKRHLEDLTGQLKKNWSS